MGFVALVVIALVIIVVSKGDPKTTNHTKFIIPDKKINFNDLKNDGNTYNYNSQTKPKADAKTRAKAAVDSIIKNNIKSAKQSKIDFENELRNLNSTPNNQQTITKAQTIINEQRQFKQNYNTGNTATNTPKKTKEELYRERLLRAKNRNNLKNIVISKATDNNNNIISFRASIYEDQAVLPGNRITLMLIEDFVYKNKLFEKNTLIFSIININKSRVLIDITNINHVPVEFHAIDLIDGNIGLYSKRAGELWAEFEAEAQKEAAKDTTDEVVKELNMRVGSGAINALQSFFSKKKIKNKEKILLINNHELIFKIKEK